MNINYILPGLIAGSSEMIIFHPIDTLSKIIMNTKGTNTIKFSDFYIKNLYNGIFYSSIYRIPQRIYKFGIQPVILNKVNMYSDNIIFNSFLSGGITGASEILLLPLDVIKVKAQTKTLNGGVINLLYYHKNFLSLGFKYGLIRGAIASSTLFGTKSIIDNNEYEIYSRKISKNEKNIFGSILSGIFAVIMASPFDVLKTRAQTETFKYNCFFTIIKNEGPSALFLGLIPKITVIGPKMGFSFYIANMMQEYLSGI